MQNHTMPHDIAGNRPVHEWLRKIRLSHVPRHTNPVLEQVIDNLLACFEAHGHQVQTNPGDGMGVNVIITSAKFGQPVHWKESLTLTARRRFGLEKAPTVFTILYVRPSEFDRLIAHYQRALKKSQPDPADFAFPGMAKEAYYTLFEQGKRGGPMMAILRQVQAQAMSVRNILVVGEEEPLFAYTFDLVGAFPRSDASAGEGFYEDLMYRILTAASTHEITDHEYLEDEIPLAIWQSLATPKEMQAAGQIFGKLGFFTEMVKVANLVNVPLLEKAIASQYSEGCFATWDPVIGGLVSTITGSARPVEKDNLTEDELAVVTAVRADRRGARVRRVSGKRNDPPSSEAVELVGLDEELPRILLKEDWPVTIEVPVTRSKLHGHRSVRSYDPIYVEHVYLDPPYYAYPVSCSTEAQANAIRAAFARSEALQNPQDPRKVVFTILPGHGVLIAEKWVAGKAPFQVIWEYMKDGKLEIENEVPQGALTFIQDASGRMVLTSH
jgi:hypothetical protein